MTAILQFDAKAAVLPAANFAVPEKVNGSNFSFYGLKFDAATDESCFFSFSLDDYDSGNPTLDIYWYADTASSGDVVWGAQVAAITPNTDTQDIETDGLATAVTVTDSHLGTTGQRLHKATITVNQLDSLAAGDYLFLKIYRDANNGSDTLSGDVYFLAASFTYTNA